MYSPAYEIERSWTKPDVVIERRDRRHSIGAILPGCKIPPRQTPGRGAQCYRTLVCISH